MTMRWLLSMFLAGGLCVTMTAGADDRLRDETVVTRTLHFSGEGVRTLDVRVLNGSIRVTGDRGSDVRVEAKQTIRARTAEGLKAGRRDVALETRADGSTVDVVVRDGEMSACGEFSGPQRNQAWWDRRLYHASVNVRIRVPAETRVRLCAVNGQEISVAGTSGDFDVSHVNGRIALEGMRGSGRATTVNGGIVASFAEAPRTESLFKSVNGTLAVTFPAGLSADLRMKTFNGGLFTDFETQPVARTVQAERRGSRYVYRRDEFTTFRVGNGGPELTFDAFNGDVRVLRAAR